MERFMHWFDGISTSARIILVFGIAVLAVSASLGVRAALRTSPTEAQRIADATIGTSTTSGATVTSATCRPGNVMQFYALSTDDALSGIQTQQEDFGDAYLIGPGSTQLTRTAYNTTLVIQYANGGSGDLIDSDICALKFSDSSYGWYDVSSDSAGNISWDTVPGSVTP